MGFTTKIKYTTKSAWLHHFRARVKPRVAATGSQSFSMLPSPGPVFAMHSLRGLTLSSALADGHQLHCPASPTVRCDRARQRSRSRQLLLDTSLSGPGVRHALSFGACPVTNTAWCHHFRARIDLFNRHNGISNLLEASSPRSDNTTHSLSGLPRIADHGELTWFHHFPLTLLPMSLWTDPVLTYVAFAEAFTCTACGHQFVHHRANSPADSFDPSRCIFVRHDVAMHPLRVVVSQRDSPFKPFRAVPAVLFRISSTGPQQSRSLPNTLSTGLRTVHTANSTRSFQQRGKPIYPSARQCCQPRRQT